MRVEYDVSLAQFLEEIPDKALVEAVVVGETTETVTDYGNASEIVQTGKVLLPESVFPVADKIPQYTPVYIWTKDWIYFLHEYDGQIWLVRVPRNPVDTMPEFSGEDIPEDN